MLDHLTDTGIGDELELEAGGQLSIGVAGEQRALFAGADVSNETADDSTLTGDASHTADEAPAPIPGSLELELEHDRKEDTCTTR